MSVDGALSSTQGMTSQQAYHFQATNCAALAFNSRVQGLDLRGGRAAKTARASTRGLSFPTTPQGTEANIASVKVELPKQLPSRLTTLQKACTGRGLRSRTPRAAPPASMVGIVKAVTPLLPVPLDGPAYFVSHGGEAFPSLIVVLQGDGVTVDLVGATFISKAGITSSTFKTVPDVPVGSFELYLPEGQYSALAANGNLCKGKLMMPTEFIAQNGASDPPEHQDRRHRLPEGGEGEQGQSGARAGPREEVGRRAHKVWECPTPPALAEVQGRGFFSLTPRLGPALKRRAPYTTRVVPPPGPFTPPAPLPTGAAAPPPAR